MDLISIIVPYYKKKRFIKEAINSVLKQTYKNIEIILIYDDAERGDLDYIKSIKNLDNRIKLIVNNKNYGAGFSRNIGIKLSRGNYIAFLDSDDRWYKKKLEKQISFLKNKNAHVCHTSYKIVDYANKVIGYRKAKNYSNFEDLIKSCDIGLSTVMLKKKIINSKCQFANLKTKEDFVLWLKILKRNYDIIALNEYLTIWRRLDNSLSSSIFQKLIDGFRVYNFYMGYSFFRSLYFLFCLSFNYFKKK
jgi:teichuronic acid biosynthesis glycosyltransferase TuaG